MHIFVVEEEEEEAEDDSNSSDNVEEESNSKHNSDQEEIMEPFFIPFSMGMTSTASTLPVANLFGNLGLTRQKCISAFWIKAILKVFQVFVN